jgi:hypothetical protein
MPLLSLLQQVLLVPGMRSGSARPSVIQVDHMLPRSLSLQLPLSRSGVSLSIFAPVPHHHCPPSALITRRGHARAPWPEARDTRTAVRASLEWPRNSVMLPLLWYKMLRNTLAIAEHDVRAAVRALSGPFKSRLASRAFKPNAPRPNNSAMLPLLGY